MKKVGSLVLAVCLVFGCFGCQNQQDALYSAAKEEGPSSSLAELASPPPSPEEEELTGELTIRHVAGGDNLQYFAKLFQQLHPGVEVTMVPTYSSQTEWSQSPDTHVPQLSTELMGGEAYDVVGVSMLETYRFAKAGLFEDLLPWMESDPAIDQEDFYGNILEALKTDGKLYGLTWGVNYQALCVNGFMAAELGVDVRDRFPEGADYQEIVDLFVEMQEAGIATEETEFAYHQSPCFFDEFEFASYFDLAQGVCTFDSAPFADYLAAVDALPWDREVRGGLDYSQGTYVFKAADYFCFRQMVAMSNLPHVDGRYAETGSTPSILLHSTSGDYPFGVSSLLAIPAASENKELAWEFLKFVVNTQEFPEKVTPYYDPQVGMQLSNLYLSCIPLNRENFFRLGESLGWGERLLEQFDRYNQKLNARNPITYELNAALEQVRENYHTSHLITAEECAQQMQERAEIYLKE